MRIRANSSEFREEKFPNLQNYPSVTSRMYEKKDEARNDDCWWFKFGLDKAEDNEFLVFAGAKDYVNKEFKIFKVPSSYLLTNLDKIYKSDKDWIILYVHFKTYKDVRSPAGGSVLILWC